MNSNLQPNSDGEVSLKELILILWAYKYFITAVTILAVLCGGYFALTTKKVYTASAVFSMSTPEKPNLNIGGNVDSIARLAGINIPSKSILSEKDIKGRIFVEKINSKLNFIGDRYFNTYNPNRSKDPFWKSEIKRITKYKRTEVSENEIIWQGIVRKYKKNVFLDVSKENIITIKVLHENAFRAAEISNSIMETVISNAKERLRQQTKERLSYLTSIMADSLSDLENVQSKLKTFTIENGSLPVENFAFGSFELDALRKQLIRTDDLYIALIALDQILQKKNPSISDYKYLISQHPIVEQIEFRRLVGQSETSGKWRWPDRSSVTVILQSILQGKKKLEFQINEAQESAIQSSEMLEIYAKLKRQEKISEATYAVLIEQVKSQSMTAGFTPDMSIIYEYASPSITPTSPNKTLYVALSFILGVFIGSALSFIIGFRNRVYYSKEILIAEAMPRFIARTKELNFLNKKSLDDIRNLVLKKPLPSIRGLVSEIHKSKSNLVVISSSKTKLKSNNLANMVASFMQQDKLKVAIIDFSAKDIVIDKKLKSNNFGPYQLVQEKDCISILQPINNSLPLNFLSNKNFSESLQSLNKFFDFVITCADNDDSVSLTRAMQLEEVFHIMLVRTKYTKYKMFTEIKNCMPIQGLLHD